MKRRGFTLLELSVSIGIVSLIVTGTVLAIALEVDSSRQADTMEKIMLLKRAIVGDPRIVTKESRTDFGYAGDMGSLPAALSDLWIRPTGVPVFTYSSTAKTGAGWPGPYILVGPLEFANELTLDAWGNPLQYQRWQTAPFPTSSTTNQEYRAKIFSFGPDGGLGGGDDITAEIHTTEIFSKVLGYIRDSSGNPMPNVPVKIYYPVNGSLGLPVTTSALSNGSYSFPDLPANDPISARVAYVPFGNRSITIEPKLVYSEGSGVTTGAGQDSIEFVVISYTCGTIYKAKAVFENEDNPGLDYYTKVMVNNSTVFNNTTNLAASDEDVTFSQEININWSGCGVNNTSLSQTFPIRIQSPFTQVPDKDIGTGASAGKSFRIRIQSFESQDNGSGTALKMTGVSFTVTFYHKDALGTPNGTSIATFQTVPQ